MHGELLVEIAMLATSLGLVVPVLTDAVVLHHPLGVLRGVRVCGLSHRGRGAFARSRRIVHATGRPTAAARSAGCDRRGGPGCRTYRHLTALADRLADIQRTDPHPPDRLTRRRHSAGRRGSWIRSHPRRIHCGRTRADAGPEPELADPRY